jgi:DNA invertase Pin-like site-specific DNA recombinase
VTDRIYARISLDTKVSGSIDKQTSRLRKVADADAVVYPERSVSGSKVRFADRPEGSRLLADLRSGDRVLVTKIDRAARNVRDLLDLVETIEARGASITFVDQAIDTAGPMGRFLLTLLGAIAELEAGIIAERRRESLEAFRAEGRHAVGRAPYGLQSVPNPNGRGLVLRPHPEEAPVIRQAVEGILAGDSQRKWAPVVGMGEPAFARLLRNERLAGILDNNGDGLRLDPEQALFSLAEWQRLQAHLTRPDKAWSKAEGFGEVLFCSECGDRLYLNKAAKKPEYATYRCRKVAAAHKRDGAPSASVVAVNADAYVERTFLDLFGEVSVRDEVTISTDAAKEEAVAAARLRLDAARAALDAADEDEEEERMGEYLAAKRGLRDAQAMESEHVVKTIDLGVTFGEMWAEATTDAERVILLQKAGRWVVQPGRLTIEQKVTLVPVEEEPAA